MVLLLVFLSWSEPILNYNCYYFVRQEQFSQTLEHLLESTVRNKKLYELKYTQYADPYLKYMMLQGFEAFVNDNLSVIWTTQFMQVGTRY